MFFEVSNTTLSKFHIKYNSLEKYLQNWSFLIDIIAAFLLIVKQKLSNLPNIKSTDGL